MENAQFQFASGKLLELLHASQSMVTLAVAFVLMPSMLGRCSFGPWIAALPLDGLLGTH